MFDMTGKGTIDLSVFIISLLGFRYFDEIAWVQHQRINGIRVGK